MTASRASLRRLQALRRLVVAGPRSSSKGWQQPSPLLLATTNASSTSGPLTPARSLAMRELSTKCANDSSREVPERVQEAMKDYSVISRLDVRWGDMDAMGHVNNAVYFKYFETARIFYLEKQAEFGLSEDVGLTPKSVGPILAEISCRYKAQVKYPDHLYVGCRTSELGEDSLIQTYKAVSEATGRVVAEGRSRLVYIDYRTGKKVQLPEPVLESIRRIDGDLPRMA